MIRWCCKLFLHMINSSSYCCNISCFSSGEIIFRTNRSLLISPPFPSQRLLYSFLLSQSTEKTNNTISQMWLRSVFKMRTSILNTATTEQMGYGTISFFVCFPLMNQRVDLFFFVYYNSASVMVLN